MASVVGYLKNRKFVKYAKDGMGPNIFYELCKVHPLFLGDMNHPSMWTEDEIGDGKDKIGSIPMAVLKYHITQDGVRLAFMDYMLRNFNVTIAELFTTSTELVQVEHISSTIYAEGMSWTRMITRLQENVALDLRPKRTVVHLTITDLVPKFQHHKTLLEKPMRAKIYKMLVRFLHESAIGCRGEFCGIGFGNITSQEVLHDTLRKLVSTVDEKGMIAKKDVLKAEQNLTMHGVAADDAANIVKDAFFLVQSSRSAVTRPWIDRTDFEFMGLSPNKILNAIKMDIRNNCNAVGLKNESIISKACEDAEKGWEGKYEGIY